MFAHPLTTLKLCPQLGEGSTDGHQRIRPLTTARLGVETWENAGNRGTIMWENGESVGKWRVKHILYSWVIDFLCESQWKMGNNNHW